MSETGTKIAALSLFPYHLPQRPPQPHVLMGGNQTKAADQIHWIATRCLLCMYHTWNNEQNKRYQHILVLHKAIYLNKI